MTQHRTLLDCPKDIRESIDWLLRVSGKDTGRSCFYGINSVIGGDDVSGKLLKTVEVLLGRSDISNLNSTITGLAFELREFVKLIKLDSYSYSYSNNASWENLCKGYPAAKC